MMHYLSFFLLLAGTVLYAQNGDLLRYELSGKIRSVRSIATNMAQNATDKENEPANYLLTFNENGTCNNGIFYHTDTVASRTTYQYNEQGLLTVVKTEFPGLFTQVDTFIYNDRRVMEVWTKATGDTFHLRQKDSSAANGDLLRRSYYDSLANLDFFTDYVQTDTCLMEITKNSDGQNLRECLKYNDTNGWVVKKTELEISTGNPDSLEIVRTDFVYTHNDKGHLTSVQTLNQGKITTTRTYIHRYDQDGNWIWRMESVDGLTTTVIKREIVYHDN